MAEHNKLGVWGEERAVGVLEELGYFIRDRNWRFHHYELDIVAFDKQTLVFVEVKTRSSLEYGEPLVADGPKKVRNLIQAANQYIIENELLNTWRFDIICVYGNEVKSSYEHIIDAFDPFLLSF